MKSVDWVVRIVAAVILLQTLFFKFLGAEESVFIFSQLGIEPWGRIASGVVELAAATLLLIPRTAWVGALIASAVMTGAILSHLFVLGIVVQNDSGLLFLLAITVLVCSLATFAIHRSEIPFLGGLEGQ